MKFFFIAFVYFAVGFSFPYYSGFTQILLGALMLFATIILIGLLYDDRLEEGAYL